MHPDRLSFKSASNSSIDCETGKGRARPCQVSVEKTSESKPPMNRRKRRDDVKTRGKSLLWDQLGGNLFTAQAASGGRGGVSSTQALVWNVGTCVSMPREQLKRTTRESLSTEAGHRGGAVRSSAEGSVMGLERRGGTAATGGVFWIRQSRGAFPSDWFGMPTNG